MTFHKLILISFFFVSFFAVGQTVEELEQTKKDLQDKISFTNSLLSKNKKNKSASIQQLELMNNKIALEEKMISNMNLELLSLDKDISKIKDQIIGLEQQLTTIRDDYAKLIYTSWKMTQAGKELHYILAGYDLQMVYRRFRYIMEFNHFKRGQAEKIQVVQSNLEQKKLLAVDVREEKNLVITAKNQQLASLTSSKDQKQQVVNDLQHEERSLKKQLNWQQKKVNELETFIQNILKKEMAEAAKTNPDSEFGMTPEDILIGDNFSQNYSRLPWPVDKGIITLGYGTYTPEGQKRVKLNSNGVEITSAAGSDARAVFKGTVLGVYALPGYNSGVIIKHGGYFSFYANLEKVYVKSGEKVDHKQKLGKIFKDPESGNSVLHFEIYKDKAHVNPQLWLSK